MKLSIIVPVFNEEKTVLKLLEKVVLVELPFGVTKEVIVVDDGSTDKTSVILSDIKRWIKRKKDIEFNHITFPVNSGKGMALREGFKISSGDLIIVQDADLEYDPVYFSDLLKPIFLNNANVVYGTRLKNYPLKLWGVNKTPLPSHWIGNKILTFITNLFYSSKLSDMETCYKVFKRNVLDGMELRSNRFEIEPEITAKFLKKGIQIIEVPIKTKPRTLRQGKKIKWIDGFIAIWSIIKYRFVD